MTQERRAWLEAQLVADRGRSSHGYSPPSDMSALCALCTAQLAVTGAGATVLSPVGDGDGQATRRGLVHATNDVSAGLEKLQLTVGEGPCLDAFSLGGPVLIPDLDADTARWPAFSSAALDLGAAAVFSFPLQIGAIRLGSLDCYRRQPSPLSQVQLADALILADLATHEILQQLEDHASHDTSWLADPHAEVHQASGMVQVQLATTTEAALLRLRAHAYTHELAISEAARQVITRQLRFTPDEEFPDADLA